jgi:short-subunit dehydrogenase
MSQKLAIVTAAIGGMGELIASKLYREGYRLALMSRSDELLIVAEGNSGHCFIFAI